MNEFAFDTKHDRYPVAAHVFLTQHGQVLLQRRTGSGYADGQLALPAGHVDLGETPTECIAREVHEELGIDLTPESLQPAITMFRRSLEPRVDFFFTASSWTGQPTIREPHKCTELIWADPSRLPHDTIDFVAQAWADAQHTTPAFREFGFTPAPTLR